MRIRLLIQAAVVANLRPAKRREPRHAFAGGAPRRKPKMLTATAQPTRLLPRLYAPALARCGFARRLVFSVSIGCGSARRQFGHSSLVAGMFGRSSTAIASSSVAVRMRDGALASASWTLRHDFGRRCVPRSRGSSAGRAL